MSKFIPRQEPTPKAPAPPREAPAPPPPRQAPAPAQAAAPPKSQPVVPAWAEPSGEAAAAPSAPSHQEVAIRAFELWVAEGSPHGRDRDHWFEAERQIRKP